MNLRIVSSTALIAIWATGAAIAGDSEPAQSSVPPEVNWLVFDEALESARTAGKHIMVDVYTDWCGWCKRLDKETYADLSVRGILAESFVSSKVKGDSPKRLSVAPQTTQVDGKTLLQFVKTDSPAVSEQDLTRRQWRVTGFPTILFFSADGKLITKLPGFYDAKKFHDILNYVKDDLYEVMTFQDYLESLRKAEDRDSGTKS